MKVCSFLSAVFKINESKLNVSYCVQQLNTLQFKKSPPKVPYKAIALAIFLFLIGSLLIVFGALLLAGTIKVEVSFGPLMS